MTDKKRTRRKKIVVKDVSTGETKEYKYYKDIQSELGFTKDAMLKFAENKAKTSYLRSRLTGKLYTLEVVTDKVCTARCEDPETEQITFPSVNKVLNHFRICKNAYYNRAKKQPLNTECKSPITDAFGRKWFLTFHELPSGKYVCWDEFDKR